MKNKTLINQKWAILEVWNLISAKEAGLISEEEFDKKMAQLYTNGATNEDKDRDAA